MFKIKKKTYYIVLVVLLIMPILFQSKLLFFGKKIDGYVVGHRSYTTSGRYGGKYTYAVIRYKIDNIEYEVFGPDNIIYERDKKFTVLFNENNPEESIIFSFTSIYIRKINVISGFLLIIWMVFYATFKEKKIKTII